MSRSWAGSIILASALAFAACTGDRMAGPAPSNSSGSGDTSHVAPSIVDLSGHVLAMRSGGSGQGGDTLSYDAISGVQLKLMHNILVDGSAEQELAGTTVSDAQGAYHFANLPSGYYVLYAYPTTVSGYKANYSLVPAQSAQVTVDVFVWKTP